MLEAFRGVVFGVRGVANFIGVFSDVEPELICAFCFEGVRIDVDNGEGEDGEIRRDLRADDRIRPDAQ